MRWIDDVRHELTNLDNSTKNLRKFAVTIGVIFILFSVWLLYNNIFTLFSYIFLPSATLLIYLGFVYPKRIKKAYKIWMGIAFILGWFVSRFLLSILFILVLTPIGLIAKVVNKKFLNLDFKQRGNSYWIKKDSEKIKYDKMF
jgi:Saxitoxin biosynthesis operon protein SxtJ